MPHNVLFDFEATVEGAGWIDEIAAEVKRIMDGFEGRVVVGHADWSVKHFRFKDGVIRVVYDWDSLRLDKKAVIVGTAATTFPATWYIKASSRAPSPKEMLSFVREYEEARGEPFSEEELTATAATPICVMAYSARCEHAVDREGRDLSGSFREALRIHEGAYLRPRHLGKE